MICHTFALGPLLSVSNRPDKKDMANSPLSSLPGEVVNRGKTGFSVPVREWLMGDDGAKGERGLRGWSKSVYGELM